MRPTEYVAAAKAAAELRVPVDRLLDVIRAGEVFHAVHIPDGTAHDGGWFVERTELDAYKARLRRGR